MEAEWVELPSAILAARLLILTCCRMNEIMTLQWAHVDLAERMLRLPASKSVAARHVGWSETFRTTTFPPYTKTFADRADRGRWRNAWRDAGRACP